MRERGVRQGFVRGFVLACAATRALFATEEADFSVRLVGGGVYCAGQETTVNVYTDLNLTGGNDQQVRGYAIAICHVHYQLEVLEAVPGAGFDPKTGVDADFNSITVSSRGVVQAVIVDWQQPRGIPPVNNFAALRIRYLVEDAADPAPVWPCDRTLSSPPLVITFSTGSRSYEPPPENLHGVEILSLCTPSERTFRMRTQVKEPLKVRCRTKAGSTLVDVLVREDPVACCPPRLLRGISFAVEVPQDLVVLRFLPGDLPVIKLSTSQGPDCLQVETMYLPSPRLGEEKVVLRMEVGARGEFWEEGFPPTDRELRVRSSCNSPAGAIYLDGRTVPFTPAEQVAAIHVQPHCPRFKRGDPDASGGVTIGDAVFVLSWLYRPGSAQPACMDAADSNDDGQIDIADPIRILAYLYAQGDPFPDPGKDCGLDLTDDRLDCASYPPCE